MKKDRSIPADFDRVARLYRWLEYITFGPILQRTRVYFMPHLHDRRRALLFGDGDGRFTERLLAATPDLTVDAVDTSAAMLALLQRRAEPFNFFPRPGASYLTLAGPPRLRTHKQSALTFIPDNLPDLVATHFFLDCLTQPELDSLIQRLTPTLSPDAVWLVSDFHIPPGVMRLPARLLIRTLYFGFKILTGLRVTQLPRHHLPLARAGFVRIAHRHRFFGLIDSELWQRERQTTEDSD